MYISINLLDLSIKHTGSLSLSLSVSITIYLSHMADIQEDCNNLSGIKLFGKTIAVQDRVAKDDHKPKKAEQTVEKRPDKIIPCPRCKSMETKFCYFNNYNVNQPRHFCKGCQRYWTAGGALRNVPVGAGRRKIKPPYRGLAGFSEGYLFDASAVQQFEFGTVVEWQMEEHGDFQHLFPAKRRRTTSSSQTYE